MQPEVRPRFAVRVLGPLAVEGPEGPRDPGGRKPRLLLALLLMDAGSVVSADRLVAGLWGEEAAATARKTLHVHVSNLRRSLGPDFPLETERGGYRLDLARLSIDAREFEAEVAAAASQADADPVAASEILTGALARWRGRAFADVAEEPAVRAEVQRLGEVRLLAVEQRIDADMRVGRHHEVLGELEALSTDHPFREGLQALHMLALYRAGRQSHALRAFERSRRVLAEELGIDPGPELRALHEQILRQAPELDFQPLPMFAADLAASAAQGSMGGRGRGVRSYELRELLGRGEHSVVHVAYQPSSGREVALKIIAEDTAHGSGFVAGFDADCRELAELVHPHIVTMLDHWRDPSGGYIAMPLMAGGDLRGVLRGQTSRSPARALQLLDQVGSALSHAHRHGIVHGDLRPSNVLLDADGNAYLSDFVLRRAGFPLAARAGGVAGDLAALAAMADELLEAAPLEVREVMERAIYADPAAGFGRVEDFLRALRRAYGADVVGRADRRVQTVLRNPFKGLRAFGETDAADFFGREELCEELVGRVAASRLTALVGPSGSGKSSLVRAGLLPAVRRGALRDRPVVVAEMFPGAHPFEELASALLGVAATEIGDLPAELAADDRGLLRVAKQVLPGDDTQLLLFVDQFEELFVLTEDAAVREAFIANLVTVATDPHSPVRVLLTLRADFYDRPLTTPVFGELVRSSLVSVTLPSDDGLARAIAGPAKAAGLELQSGLIPTILRDVQHEPGALPMLQYALTELADASVDGVLGMAEYDRTGGVIGALSRRADEIYLGLPAAGREAARELFVRLVAVGEDAEDTRRRVRRSELDGLAIEPAALQQVIDAFGGFRLLTFDRDPVTRGPTVEVAHEALIREWPRLREWIDARRDDLRTQRRLASAVREWRANAEDPAFLLSGLRLERYQWWIEGAGVRPTREELRFLEQSRLRQQARAAAETTRRRRILATVSALAVMALIAAGIAVLQRNEAQSLQAQAESEALVNGMRVLMARAAVHDDPELRLLIALGAHDVLAAEGLGENPDVTSALYQFTLDQAVVARIELPGRDARAVQASPDGSVVVITSRASFATAIDARTGAVLGTLDIPPLEDAFDELVGSAVDAATGQILTGRFNGTVEVWEPTGQRVRSRSVPELGRAVWPLLADERQIILAESSPGSWHLVRIVARDPSTLAIRHETEQVFIEAEPSPSGDRLVGVDVDGGVTVFDTHTWEDMTPDALNRDTRRTVVDDAAWGSDDETLWLLEDGRLTFVDTATGSEARAFPTDVHSPTFVLASRDARLVAAGRADSPVTVFDAFTGTQLATLRQTRETLLDSFGIGRRQNGEWVTWANDRRLIVGGEDGVVWDLAKANAHAALWPDTRLAPLFATPTPGGGQVIGSNDGAVEILGADGGQLGSFAATASAPSPAVLSQDGSTLAVSQEGRVTIVDVDTQAVLATGPPGHERPLALSRDGRSVVLGTARQLQEGRHLVAIMDVSGEAPIRPLAFRAVGERGTYTSDGRLTLIPTSSVEFVPTVQPNSSVAVYDAASGQRLSVGPPQECITAVAVSADDSMAATVGCDGEVTLLDIEALLADPPASRIGGDRDDATPGVGVTFGDDDRTVIVTRQDGRVQAYDATADFAERWSFDVGDHVGIPDVRDGMVWVPTTTRFTAAEHAEGGAIAMPLDLDELVDFARRSVTRALTPEECEEFDLPQACPPS